MDDAQLLTEVEDLLRAMPSEDKINVLSPDVHAWFGRARALIGAWDKIRGVLFANEVEHYFAYVASLANLTSPYARALLNNSALPNIIGLLQEARFSLRLKTTGPLSISVNRGQPHDYFDELRKLIALAQSDIMFVDPYMNADFVTLYLPHVRANVTVRLIASKNLATLLPAVDLFVRQHGLSVEVRKTAGRQHDRYILIDKSQCYLSGATFQDGGLAAPATLQQISDASAELIAIYESEWASAAVARKP